MFELIVNHFLGKVPVWVFPFMAGAGFATYIIAGIAQHIQPVRIYALIARPIAIIVMVAGVFLYGGAGVVAIQQQELLEAQQKIALAEQASKDASDKLAQALADNEHLIKGRAYGVSQIIKQDKAKIDADCRRINDAAWADYNRAVKNTGSAK
jgi:hypothetical protein